MVEAGSLTSQEARRYDGIRAESPGALCNGIESELKPRILKCVECKRRRKFRVYERYDSVLFVCSKGHSYVSD